ncbi:MAG: glycoside hydrolase family 2 protein [Bacteroidales bacterium]|nr:glycoside hydrolase family 2 protein [Bacteroidales bacterium]
MNLIRYFLFLFGILVVFSTCQPRPENMERINLAGEWQFQKQADTLWLEAKVPGTVQTDLFHTNRIPNPFISDNEQQNKWVENENWRYRKTFLISEQQLQNHSELVFEGLDTYATVFLNDQQVIVTDNMFRTYQMDVSAFLKLGENKLEILFESPVQKAIPLYDSLPYRLPADNDRNEKQTSVFTRKAAYQYGWDWGPRYVTMGIWRPVYLQFWKDYQILENRLHQIQLSDSEAMVAWTARIYSETETQINGRINLGKEEKIKRKFKLIKGVNQFSDTFRIENPQRWWPNGYGEAKLYEFGVELSSEKQLFTEKKKIGFRTVELITEPDSIGESFYFKVNDIPIYAKGANYIPQDNFLPSVDSSRYAQIIKSAKAANMNMLRVWGGGIYENDLLYDLCDENGILLWQDFMFACSLYPSDPAFLKNVEFEARDNIIRLRDHASLALWCGNNEINELWYNWGYQKKFGYSKQDSLKIWNDYQNLFHRLLPDLIQELNSEISYWESSPKIGWGHPESRTEGDSHYWGIWWGKEPFEVYEAKVPRFASEFGFQSFPQMSTLLSFADTNEMNMDSKAMKAHQKSSIGNETIVDYMKRDFPVPDNFAGFVYVSQLLQAEGLSKALEAQRRAKPRNMGSLYWQLNDCWPGISWSSLDYFGNWKALHYEAQHDFATFLISKEGNSIYVVSDSLKDVDCSLILEMKSFEGKKLFYKEISINVKANSSEKIEEIPILSSIKSMQNQLLIEAKLYHHQQLLAQNSFYFNKPMDLILPQNVKPVFEIRGQELLIWSETGSLIKNLYLETSSHLAKNFFDVLPQDTVRIPIEKSFSISEIKRFQTLNSIQK